VCVYACVCVCVYVRACACVCICADTDIHIPSNHTKIHVCKMYVHIPMNF